MCETFCLVDIVNMRFTLFTLVLFILRRVTDVFLVPPKVSSSSKAVFQDYFDRKLTVYSRAIFMVIFRLIVTVNKIIFKYNSILSLTSLNLKKYDCLKLFS